jgi:hypothetical protein
MTYHRVGSKNTTTGATRGTVPGTRPAFTSGDRVVFVDHCLSFSPFPFSYCIVCPSSIHGSWLPFLYLQTFLKVTLFSFVYNDKEI